MKTYKSQEFQNHKVFEDLKTYSSFYQSLSFSTMSWLSLGSGAVFNLDLYLFQSISQTILSISDILKTGRLNDSYSLMRKYYDCTIINIYSKLYLENEFSIDDMRVELISNWRLGKQPLPEYREMHPYVIDSPKLIHLKDTLRADGKLKKIRQRCNDNMHYNSYNNFLMNLGEVYDEKRLVSIDLFQQDIRTLFIQHFAYLFTVKENYLMSTDYSDCIDVGSEPDEEMLKWVAPFIKKVFKEIIEPNNPKLSLLIREHTEMQL